MLEKMLGIPRLLHSQPYITQGGCKLSLGLSNKWKQYAYKKLLDIEYKILAHIWMFPNQF